MVAMVEINIGEEVSLIFPTYIGVTRIYNKNDWIIKSHKWLTFIISDTHSSSCNVCCLHGAFNCSPYACTYDFNLYLTKCWSCSKSPFSGTVNTSSKISEVHYTQVSTVGIHCNYISFQTQKTVFESPHTKMNFIIELAWGFSTVIGKIKAIL